MRRLIDGGGDDFGATVIRSARGDAPTAGARERAAVALGIGAGGAVVAASALAGGHAAGGAGVASSSVSATIMASAAGVGGATLAMKLGVAFLAAGVLATGALAVAAKPHAPRGVVTHGSTTAPATVAVASAAAEVPSAPTPSVVVTPPLPTAPLPPTRAAVASRPLEVAPAPGDDLGRAMSLLESARAALDVGDAAKALAIVGEYERQFPNGSLTPEANVLRIEALVARGSKSEALAAADQFLAASPDSPHARHVRAIAASIRAGSDAVTP